MKLNLEVRNNPLVTLFGVYVDGLGGLQPNAFTNKQAGIFTFSQDITVSGNSLLVRYTIVGVGSNIQTPTGVCLVSFGDPPPTTPPATSTPKYLKPYLIAAVTVGNTADSEEFAYPTNGATVGPNQIPGFSEL